MEYLNSLRHQNYKVKKRRVTKKESLTWVTERDYLNLKPRITKKIVANFFSTDLICKIQLTLAAIVDNSVS